MGLDEIYARMKKRQTEQNERAEQNKKEKQKASGGLEAVYDRMRAAAQSENYNNTVKSQRATAERAAKTGNPVAISDTEAIRRQREAAQYYRTGAAAGAAYENKPIMQADQSVKTPATDYVAKTLQKKYEQSARQYARDAMSFGKQVTEAQQTNPSLAVALTKDTEKITKVRDVSADRMTAWGDLINSYDERLEKLNLNTPDELKRVQELRAKAVEEYHKAEQINAAASKALEYQSAWKKENDYRALLDAANKDPNLKTLMRYGKSRFDADQENAVLEPNNPRKHIGPEYYDIPDSEYLTDADKGLFYYLYAKNPVEAKRWAEYAKEQNRAQYFQKQAEIAGQTPGNRINAMVAGTFANIAAGPLWIATLGEENVMDAARYGKAWVGGAAEGLNERGLLNTGFGAGTLPEDIPVIGGKGLGAIYELGSSMLQSASVAPLGAWGGAIVLGSSAAASDYTEMIDNGFDKGTAMLHATCAGIAESLFEYVSLDKLINQDVTRGLLRNIMTQAGVEASEEINTTLANTITDEAILGSQSQRNRRAQELMALGMSYQDAKKQADREWLSDLLYDGLAGAASGGLMTAGNLVNTKVYDAIRNQTAQRYQNVETGAQLAQNENLRAGVDELAKNYGIKGLEQERVNAAQEIQTKYENRAKEEESGRQSEVQAQKNGERIATTDASAGLAMTETEEAQKTKTELRQERKEARQERRERNRDLSVYEKNARKLGKTGEAVVSRLTEDFKSAKTLAQIEAKKSALVENAQNKQGVGELADIAAERVIADEYGKAKTLAELEQLHKAYAASVKDEGLRSAAGRAYAARSYALQENAAEGRLSRQRSRYAYAGQNLDMTASYERDGQTVVTKIQKISEDGKRVVLENGETMAVKDLHLDADTKDVLQKLTSYGIDGQSANYLLRQIQTAQATNRTSMFEIMSQYLLAFAQGQNGAITMEEAIRRSTLDAKTAEIAYKQGRKYAEEQAQKHKAEREENRKGRSERTLKEGQTRANRKGINGRRSIIDKSAIRGMNLNSQQSEQVRLATAVAEALGVDIRFWASTASEKGEFRGKQGEYHDGVIEIDVNAGRYTTADLKSGILRTMAHELTHFIQDFSEDMYEDLKRTAFEVLAKQGGYDSFEALVDSKIDRASYDMTRMEAEDEVLADACELMLRDSKVLQQAYAQNEKLGKKLLQWVARVIAKIRAYVGEAEHLEAKWIDQMDAELRKAFQDKWDAALRNASVEFGESFAEANEGLVKYGVQIDSESGAAVQESIRTAPVTEKEIEDAVRRLVESDMGFDAKEARKWLKSLSTVSSVILTNMMVLDYENDSRYSWLKKNSDYTQGSVDFNNNCPKRVQFTAIFDRLQKEMPNRVFTASDYEAIRQTLIKHGVTVTCGPCFVEDRRQHTGEIAQKFIDQLKYGTLAQKFQTKVGNDTYIPTQYDLVTYDGLKHLYETHRGLHDAFVAFNNARGMAAARLLEGMAEYNNQIKKWSKRTIQSKNSKGGLRIFSLSDADPRTMIDTIQIVIDAAEKGLMIQGYTKKPWFARMVKDTGIRLLRSNIPKGVGFRETANGRVLVYDLEEGINRYDRYYKDQNGIDIGYSSKNIGDNIIGINDDMIRVAMATEEIDQIIPFHSSLANYIRNQKKIGDWKNYKDEQTDKDAKTGKVADKQINIYKDVLNAYKAKGNPIQNRQQFVEAFLEVCKDRGLTPRFERFLDKKNGEYVYTPGYEKFLVDYKLFDRKTGDIITQEAVKPIFDDEFNQQILTEYVSGAEGVKVADEDTYQAVKGLFAQETDGAKYSERDVSSMSDKERKSYLFNISQTKTGSKLKTMGGSDIQRSTKYGIGKEIGGRIYVHRQYADRVVPLDVLELAQQTLAETYPDFEYNCVEWSPKDNVVRFDEAPFFDTAREPAVGDYVIVSPNGTATKGHTDYIWHHKWQWVDNDYNGFDVRKSWEWSKRWLNTINGKTYDVNGKTYNDRGKSDGNGIGRWNAQLDAYGLPRDEDTKGTKSRYSVRTDQEHTSEDTSIPSTASTFTHFLFNEGDRILDYGGGQYNIGKDAVNYGYDGKVTMEVVDLFNRTDRHNKKILDEFKENPADAVTVNNVLNVIKEPEIRRDVAENAKKYVKPGGIVYFCFYKGVGDDAGKGVGSVTKQNKGNEKHSSYQTKMETKAYIPELKHVFKYVVQVDDFLLASDKPITNDRYRYNKKIEDSEISSAIKAYTDQNKKGAPSYRYGEISIPEIDERYLDAARINPKTGQYDTTAIKNIVNHIALRENLDAKTAKELLKIKRDTDGNVIPISSRIDMDEENFIRYSEREKSSDEDYLAAVKRGDMETAQRMVMQAANRAGYLPVERYHQTARGNNFTRFRTDNPVAGLYDSETPNGIFLKTNDHFVPLGLDDDARRYKQMPLFIQRGNFLYFENREQANSWYQKHVKGYAELQNEMKKILQPHDKELDDLLFAQYEDDITTEEYQKRVDKYNAKIEETQEIENEYRKKLRDLLNWYFLNGNSGYNGIELAYDGHRYVDGKRENVHTFIVFSPSQVKSADPVTYDDNGEVIPLSKRFNQRNEDIRWSERDPDRVSDAEVIEALDEAAAPNKEAAALVREAHQAQTEISDLAKWRDKARHNADLLRQALASKNRDISDLEKTLDAVRKDLKEQAGEKRDWRDRARHNADLLQQAMESKNRDIRDIRNQLALLQQTLERGAAALDERIARGQRILEAKQRNPVVREMIEKTRKAVEERKNAQIGRIRETRKASELRGRIKNLRDQIQRKLLHPTETSYIPAELSKAMVAALDALDFSPREGTKAAAKYAEVADTLRKLSAAYGKMNDPNSLLNQIDYDQDVRDKIDALAEVLDGRNVRELNSTELQEVYRIVKQIAETARDAAYTIGRRERANLYQLGTTEIANQRSLGQKKRLLRGVRLDALSPMRAVHMIGGYGDSVIYDFFLDIEEGEGTKDRVVMDSNKTMQELRTGKNEAQYLRAVWQQKDYGIKDVNGKTVLLTPMQAMQIVMSWEREAANDKLVHIENGGILVRDARDVMRGKAKAKAGQKVQLTQDDVIRIQSKLTEYDKQYMAAAREVFRSLFGQTNDVLYQLKHRVNVGEELYIPFIVNDDLLPVSMDRGNEVDVLTKINGATKELKAGASQGIVIDGLENVLNRHINQQADFIGLAIPIRNLAKLLNVKTIGRDASVTTVKEAISDVWGDGAYRMMTQTLRNLQSLRDGGYETGVSKAMQKLQEAFVRAALVGKISVVIKQAASYESAGSYLSQRALAAARHNILEFFASPNNRHAKKVMQRWDARTAELFKRRIGMSMEEIAMNRMSKGAIKRSLQSVGAQLERSAVGRAVRDVGQATDPVNWIQRMDVATTMALAIACEYQARIDGYKKGTEEYEQHVTELYERVLRDTQPQYDALHRPMLQQSNGRGMELVKAVMPFRTVPFQNFGQLADTFGEVQNAFRTKTGQREAVKKFGKTVLSQFNSSVIFAMLTALAYGLKHNVKRYLDDDDELTQESFWARFWKDVGDTNLSTLLPYGGSEIEDIVEKWSAGEKSTYDLLSVGALDLLNTTYKSVERMRDAIDQYAAGEKSKQEMLDQIKATAYQVSQMLGIPAKNLREIVSGIEGNINGGFFTDTDVNRADKKNVERYLKAYDAGDTQKMQAVYDELVRNFAAKGKDEEAVAGKIAESVHDRIKDELRNGGELSRDVELLWQLGQTQEKTEQYVSGAAYDLYKKGEIDAETAVLAATRFGGKTEQEAERRTKAIAFNLENEELGWDVDRAEAYLFTVPKNGGQTKSAEQNGITPEEYQRYKDAVSGVTGEDRDGDGKTDSGSKKKAVINALRNAGFSGGKLLWFVNAAGYKDTTVN